MNVGIKRLCKNCAETKNALHAGWHECLAPTCDCGVPQRHYLLLSDELTTLEADLARKDAAVEAAKRVDHLIWFDVRVAGQEAVEAQHALHSALAALEGGDA